MAMGSGSLENCMTVTLMCNLCKVAQTLEPGDQSELTGGRRSWQWIKASSFDNQFVILPESLCPDCQEKIKFAKGKAEVEIRLSINPKAYS